MYYRPSHSRKILIYEKLTEAHGSTLGAHGSTQTDWACVEICSMHTNSCLRHFAQLSLDYELLQIDVENNTRGTFAIHRVK